MFIDVFDEVVASVVCGSFHLDPNLIALASKLVALASNLRALAWREASSTPARAAKELLVVICCLWYGQEPLVVSLLLTMPYALCSVRSVMTAPGSCHGSPARLCPPIGS